MTAQKESILRVIALHKPGVGVGLPGGMPGCQHCSCGPWIGDEGGSGAVVWPCPTLRALAGIPHTMRAQRESQAAYETWLEGLGK